MVEVVDPPAGPYTSGGGATYGWLNKEQILEQVGMSDLLDSPTRPKPVKTISITPPPQTPEAPLPAQRWKVG